MGTKMEYNRDTINARIEEARKEYTAETGKRLSYDKMAEILGVNKTTILFWLKDNKNGFIPLWALLDLCNLFKCDLGYLLGEHTTKRHQNETPCKITGLEEKTINLLNGSTQAQKAHFDKIIQEALGDKNGFYFDLMEEQNEARRLSEEAHQNPYFDLIDKIRKEIRNERPKDNTPGPYKTEGAIIGSTPTLEIKERLITYFVNEGITKEEATQKADDIMTATGLYFQEYYRFLDFARYRVLDLQNSLAIYLNEDIKQWQKTKK